MTFNIKTKTSDKCRVYPDNPRGLAPSITSITGVLMKYGLIQWSADEAVKHIERKYKWLKDRGLIDTAEQFIDRAASKSSMSGKPYLVKCGTANPVESSIWFKQELETFRKKK